MQTCHLLDQHSLVGALVLTNSVSSARCTAATPLAATLASLGLTGRVALNLGETA